MTQNIVDLFPTKIYHVPTGINCAKFLKNTRHIISAADLQGRMHRQEFMRGNSTCSYNNMRHIHNMPEFKELTQCIEEHANTYWKELNYAPQPRVVEMWSNTYKTGSYIDIHNHAPTQVVGSFYLHQPDHGGNLCFEDPMVQVAKHQPYDIKGNDIYNSSYWQTELSVKTGDLVLWPGWLYHRTRPNSSDQDRIIIGINIWNGV